MKIYAGLLAIMVLFCLAIYIPDVHAQTNKVQNLKSVTDANNIRLAWDPPDSSKTVSHYDILYKLYDSKYPNATWLTAVTDGPTRTILIENLKYVGSTVGTSSERVVIEDRTYKIRIYAVYSDNSVSRHVDRDVTLPRNSPDYSQAPPTNLQATPEYNKVTLTWNKPSGVSNSHLTDYIIQYKRTGESGYKTVKDGISTSTSATINYLQNGVKYDFRVQAVLINAGNASSISAIPGPPPRNLTAEPNLNFVTLSWDQPIDPRKVTGYKVEYRVGNGSYTLHNSNAQSPQKIFLSNAEHEFRVTTVYSSGDGASADTVFATPSPTVPDPPRNLQVMAYGDISYKLSWDAPFHNGGMPVTRYIVEYKFTEDVNDPWVKTDSNGDTSHTIPLKSHHIDKTFQGFRVYAVNAHGTSEPSNLMTNVTLVKPPGSVCSVTAEPIDRNKVKLTWTTPTKTVSPGTLLETEYYCASYSDSTPTTDYLIKYRQLKSGNSWKTYNDGKSTAERATLTIPNSTGKVYEFSVSTLNEYGMNGTLTPTSNTIIMGKPKAPIHLGIDPGVGTVKLTWDRPTNYNSDNIIIYDIEYRFHGSDNDWILYADSIQDNSITLNLDFGSYDFRVVAHPTGISLPSGVYTASHPISGSPRSATPDVPTLTLGNTGDTFVNLSWNEPNNNGSPIFRYVVEYKKHDDEWRIAQTHINGVLVTEQSTTTILTPNTSIRIANLESGTSYDFRVFADNSVGYSEPSNIVTYPSASPYPPTNLQAIPGENRITLSWTQPHDGGSDITKYIIEYKRSIDQTWKTVEATGTSHIINDLEDIRSGTTYNIRVSAVNSFGTGNPLSSIVWCEFHFCTIIPSAQSDIQQNPLEIEQVGNSPQEESKQDTLEQEITPPQNEQEITPPQNEQEITPPQNEQENTQSEQEQPQPISEQEIKLESVSEQERETKSISLLLYAFNDDNNNAQRDGNEGFVSDIMILIYTPSTSTNEIVYTTDDIITRTISTSEPFYIIAHSSTVEFTTPTYTSDTNILYGVAYVEPESDVSIGIGIKPS